MKKKLALLMAAIMTVAMVPVTALAATKLTATTNVSAGVGDSYPFVSLVEVKTDNTIVGDADEIEIRVTLNNGTFAKDDNDDYYMEDADYVDDILDDYGLFSPKANPDADETPDNGDEYLKKDGTATGDPTLAANGLNVINSIDVRGDKLAIVKVNTTLFNATKVFTLPITAYANEAGDVTATVSSNRVIVFNQTATIAVAHDDDVEIVSDGVTTFVEDSREDVKKMKPITITGLYNTALDPATNSLTLKLKGNFKFAMNGSGQLIDNDGNPITLSDSFYFLNDDGITGVALDADSTDDKLIVNFTGTISDRQVAELYVSGIYVTPTSKCDPGDVAKLTISSKDFTSTTLEVAKMVEEAVTYTVEDKELPVIWAGKDYASDRVTDDSNTLKVSVEENTGDILNTSRKATFTFPEGIEVVGIEFKEKELQPDFQFKLDENVVTIWNYSKDKTPTESEKETDFGIKFLLNAKPTFSGDVEVTLGGEFDDVTLKVATVKMPYTVEAKTTEVLIDYRYVPVNEIVVTEAEEGLLEDGDIISLAVEKMDFEDAGSYEVTDGDIEVGVEVYDGGNLLEIEVKDESTEPSTIVISGLELYLDRTLPVGGYALQGVDGIRRSNLNSRSVSTRNSNNILWENSVETGFDQDAITTYNKTGNKTKIMEGLFKYKEYTFNDSYVEVVTQARDQDDYTTNRKIVLTIGATTMAVGTETITLDTPAYINSENYTQLPLRAVSEAFGATVNWDDASRTVTIMMGQRVVSMTIGSKTMYVNGTPVAMNTAPEITNSRTFVPVRDLANALGITKIDWNEASATVTLN